MKKNSVSRRRFIKVGTGGILMGLAGYSTVSQLNHLKKVWAQEKDNLNDYNWEDHYWGFIVDTTLCIGCGRCVKACKIENNVPISPHYTRTWIERYVIDDDGEIYVDSPNLGQDGFDNTEKHYEDVDIRQSFFVPKLCNHCENPPCVQVCPVGATYTTKDGVILVDKEYCIGCGYCVQTCPYKARYISPEEHVADKCTWCYHRITKGLKTACEEVCPTGARILGDLNDLDSELRKNLRKKRVNVLKAEYGTKPKVYYVGLTGGVK